MKTTLGIWLFAGYSAAALAKPACENIRADFLKLCGTEKTIGPCIFKDEKAVKDAFAQIRAFPELSKTEQSKIKEVMGKKKPVKADISGVVTMLSKDCSGPRYELWLSTFKTLHHLKSEPLNHEARALLKERLIDREPPNPSLLAILMDHSVLNDAQDVEVIKATPEGKKVFKDLKNESRSNRDTLAREFMAAHKADPAQVQKIMAKEFALAKGLREKTLQWARVVEWQTR